VESRLLTVKVDDFQVTVSAGFVESNQPDRAHRLKRGLKIFLAPGGNGKDLVLDRKGIPLQATEVVGVDYDQREQRLGEVPELSALGVDRMEFPRAAEISRYHPSLCHQ